MLLSDRPEQGHLSEEAFWNSLAVPNWTSPMQWATKASFYSIDVFYGTVFKVKVLTCF